MTKAAGICIPAAFGSNHSLAKFRGKLTLAELFTATRTVEADLLTFDFTCITRHETSFAQLGFERCIVVNQSAGNTVTHRASLTRLAAASHVDHDVKRFSVVCQQQRLFANHDGSTTA